MAKFSSSRLASPSGVWYSSRKWPPHDSRRQGVEAQQLAELEEVGDPAGLLERLVDLVAVAEDVDVLPELLAQGGDLLEGRLQAPSLRAMPQWSHMILPSSRWNVVDRPLALDGQERLGRAFSRPCLGAP